MCPVGSPEMVEKGFGALATVATGAGAAMEVVVVMVVVVVVMVVESEEEVGAMGAEEANKKYSLHTKLGHLRFIDLIIKNENIPFHATSPVQLVVLRRGCRPHLE